MLSCSKREPEEIGLEGLIKKTTSSELARILLQRRTSPKSSAGAARSSPRLQAYAMPCKTHELFIRDVYSPMT